MIISKLLKLNYLFIFIVIIIASIGFFALFSAAGGNMNPWAEKHLIRFSIFLILLIFISLLDIKFFFKHAFTFFIASLILLASVEIAGTLGLGAKRWIKIFGISIQPSELIKVTIILALAKYYHLLNYRKIFNITSLIIPIFIILTPFIFVLIQPDLGTAAMILFLGLSIMFFAGVRIWKFVLGLIIVIISTPFLWQILKPYQHKRILAFLNPELDPLGTGYHLIQSKIALGSGGFLGKGYLQGTQSYLEYLPEKQTDFIFTLIGEEFGFIGTAFILLLFILIIFLPYYISYKSKNIFGKILSLGVSINLFLYVFFNTAMVTGLVPVVGVPLPLVSYGGTVMLSVMISFGLLMNVTVNSNIEKLD